MGPKVTIDQLRPHWMHGSGFDCDAEFSVGGPGDAYINVSHAYHTMDENGYYGDWIHFEILIPVYAPLEFIITYASDFDRDTAEENMFEEYLEDSIVGVFRCAEVDLT